jgi:hypothetical protein
MSEVLNSLKGLDQNPDQEIFKIGPEIIENFIGKAIVVMGGSPHEIQSIDISQDKKRLRILALVEKDSKLFSNCEPGEPKIMNLSIMGADYVNQDYSLTDYAKDIIEQLGYIYEDDFSRKVPLVSITEYKKYIEIEFNAEVTMAIITDSNFADKFFVVDASEEVVQKKRYESHKFKGKKKTVTFAKVYRSFRGNQQGFVPIQVIEWKNGIDADDDDDSDC